MRQAACWNFSSGMVGQLQPVSCCSHHQGPAMARLPISQMAGACGPLVTLKTTLLMHCQGSRIHSEHVAQEADVWFATDSWIYELSAAGTVLRSCWT